MKWKNVLAIVLSMVLVSSVTIPGFAEEQVAPVTSGAHMQSDTTTDFTLMPDAIYTFKLTAEGTRETPTITSGNSAVLRTEQVQKRAEGGKDVYYWQVRAVGKAGDAAGVYTTLPGQQAVRHCAVKIGMPYVKSDTTVDFFVPKNQTYAFRFELIGTHADPKIAAGNGSVLRTEACKKVQENGNDVYYFQVRAIGEDGQSSGIYTTLPGQPAVKHCAIAIGTAPAKQAETSSSGSARKHSSGNSNKPEDTRDNDGDGLTNSQEDYYKTDKNNPDTDGDGLTDYQEVAILSTNPLKKDSDGNGILDPDEDIDGDSLSNLNEFQLQGNPLSSDTDNDGLKDGEEIQYQTKLDVVDTDEDGLSDYTEVYITKTDPLSPDTDGDGIPDGQDTVEVSKNSMVSDTTVPTVEVSGIADAVKSVEINQVPSEDVFLNPTIPGYIGHGYDLSIDGEFDSAILTFAFDPSLQDDPDFEPAIYYFDEENQLLEEIPDQTVDEGMVSAPLEHFSKYILLNKIPFDEVWTADIKGPGEEGSVAKNLDISFVLDSSGSMDWNDSRRLRIELSKEFVDRLGDADRASVVDFDGSAHVVSPFTEDKDVLKQALNAIDSNGGTNIFSGMEVSLNEFETIQTGDDSDRVKVMFLLTDGEDSLSISSYDVLLKQAQDMGVTIYTVGLGSVNASKLQYIADQTHGKYYYAERDTDLYEGFDSIIGETVDYTKDSNDDGLSDYYTRKIFKGELVSGTGESFLGFDFSLDQDGKQGADFDHDGLKNGEELKVVQRGDRIYLQVLSDPRLADTDHDGYTDSSEYRNGTDPQKMTVAGLDPILEDENYAYGKYVIDKDSWGNHAAVYLGNFMFFGSYDFTLSNKKLLLNYLDKFNEAQKKQLRREQEVATGIDFERQITAEVQYQLTDILKTIDDKVVTVFEEEGYVYSFIKLLEEMGEGEKAVLFEKFTDILKKSKKNISNINLKDSTAAFKTGLKNIFGDLKDVLSSEGGMKLKITKPSMKLDVGTAFDIAGGVLVVVDQGEDMIELYNTYSTLKTNIEQYRDEIQLIKTLRDEIYDKKNQGDSVFSLDVALAQVYDLISQNGENYEKEINRQAIWDETKQTTANVLEYLITDAMAVNPFTLAAVITISAANIALNVGAASKAILDVYATGYCSAVLSEQVKAGITHHKFPYFDLSQQSVYYLHPLLQMRIYGEYSYINFLNQHYDLFWINNEKEQTEICKANLKFIAEHAQNMKYTVNLTNPYLSNEVSSGH